MKEVVPGWSVVVPRQQMGSVNVSVRPAGSSKPSHCPGRS